LEIQSDENSIFEQDPSLPTPWWCVDSENVVEE
jgi:hypothetical protein